MTTFYLDQEGGSDAADGLTFANRWKTITLGATAARIAAGDTIRIMASPDPTLVGNADWTNGPQNATRAIVSSTNATPIVVTLSSGNYTLLAPSVGDTVIVNAHATNTKANGVWAISAVNGSTTITLQDAQGGNSVGNGSGGATGTVRKATNMVVKLAAAVTGNIAVCGNQGARGNWSASANVTATVITTDFKEGGECQQLAVAAGFTTGLAAYYATGTLDLSGYQQVCFWVKQTAGTLGAASAVSVKLCTDAVGATAVHTVNLPALAGLNAWTQVNVDFGGALNAAIASVALYVNTDNGAQTLLIDNIIACKASSSADSLNISSLIGKNSGTEAWWGIQSINGTRVMLDGATGTMPAASPPRGYAGTTETVATYKRETIKTAPASAAAVVAVLNASGSAASPITYSGGWNRTDMTTQTGDTWFDGGNGNGTGLSENGATRNYVAIDRINFTRYSNGFTSSSLSSYQSIGSMAVCSCFFPCTANAVASTIGTLSLVANGSNAILGTGIAITTINRADSTNANALLCSPAGGAIGRVLQANNNGGAAITLAIGMVVGSIDAANDNVASGVVLASGVICGSITANNNGVNGITGTSVIGAKIMGGGTSGNVSEGVRMTNGGTLVLRNFTSSDSTPLTIATVNAGGMVYAEKINGIADAHQITTDGGTIVSATDQRHTASGISWKFRPTSTSRNASYPLPLALAQIACAANVAVSISIWTRRDNSNIVGTLKVAGGQLAGIASDVTVSCTPTINTWVQSSTLTVTPTEAGVLEVTFEVYDGVTTSANFWIDDIVIA